MDNEPDDVLHPSRAALGIGGDKNVSRSGPEFQDAKKSVCGKTARHPKLVVNRVLRCPHIGSLLCGRFSPSTGSVLPPVATWLG
jgi:hypothetical protein